MTDTIFAPATASGKSGVAIVRVSGGRAFESVEKLAKMKEISARKAVLTPVYTSDGEQIDEVIVICFPCPHSFTGENVVEFQTHGGRAVTALLLRELSKMDGYRMAERGEFTRRAVENGKMDLTAAEGLADLIDAETEAQRKQALRQMNGALADVYESWRKEMTGILAWLEAYIDFPEEELPETVSKSVCDKIVSLKDKITAHLSDKRGERLRDGYKIAIVGAPNAGKSSLMNRLSRKDAAIVSSIAGTTRDVIEVRMDIGGYPVTIADTAGLHETNEEIEAEGIKRALKAAREADLILHVTDGFDSETNEYISFDSDKTLRVVNKTDLLKNVPESGFAVSAKTGDGIDFLLEHLKTTVEDAMNMREEPSFTRVRHQTALCECRDALERALNAFETELAAEDVRIASRALGKITGQVQVEELLDVIFKDFCIGK